MSLEDLKKTMDPAKYVGRAREQVDAYLKNVIYPLLQENEKELGVKVYVTAIFWRTTMTLPGCVSILKS